MKNDIHLLSILSNIMKGLNTDLLELDKDKRIIHAGQVKDDLRQFRIDYMFHIGLDLDKYIEEGRKIPE